MNEDHNYLVSIIIPVYNVERYITKCLNSIFVQLKSYDEIEIIIVNDGTKDGSMQLVEPFLQYPNTTLITQNNLGLSVARNNGIEAAKGEYIWFVDSDDWITNGSIDEIIHEIRSMSSSIDLLVYKIENYDERGCSISLRSFPDIDESVIATGMSVIRMKKFQSCPMQEYIISRDFLNKNNFRFKSGIFHEDRELSIKMLLAASKVKLIPFITYCYLNRTSGSIIATPNPKRIKDLIDIAEGYHILQKNEIDNRKKIVLKKAAAENILYACNLISFYKDYLSFNYIKDIPYRRILFNSLFIFNENTNRAKATMLMLDKNILLCYFKLKLICKR